MAHTLDLNNMEAESSDCRTSRTQKTFAVKREKKKGKNTLFKYSGRATKWWSKSLSGILMSKIKYEICVIKIKSSPFCSARAGCQNEGTRKALGGLLYLITARAFSQFKALSQAPTGVIKNLREQISSLLSDLESWATNNKHFNWIGEIQTSLA